MGLEDQGIFVRVVLASRDGPTGLWVAQYSSGYDISTFCEQAFQFSLLHGFGDAAYVKVGPLDRLATGTRVRHLRREREKQKT